MGYLLIDDSASGGLKREYDTVSCKHCQAVIKVKRGSGNWCWNCAGPVCDNLECLKHCVPFFATIEKKMKRQALFKSIGLS